MDDEQLQEAKKTISIPWKRTDSIGEKWKDWTICWKTIWASSRASLKQQEGKEKEKRKVPQRTEWSADSLMSKNLEEKVRSNCEVEEGQRGGFQGRGDEPRWNIKKAGCGSTTKEGGLRDIKHTGAQCSGRLASLLQALMGRRMILWIGNGEAMEKISGLRSMSNLLRATEEYSRSQWKKAKQASLVESRLGAVVRTVEEFGDRERGTEEACL